MTSQRELWPCRTRVVVNCPRCGVEIIVCEPRAAMIYSEYQGPEGRCWDCSKPGIPQPVRASKNRL
jgi:hypothetical protein